MSASSGVDVGPCLLVCERDFVRGKADNFAVLFVDLAFALDERAREHAVDEG